MLYEVITAEALTKTGLIGVKVWICRGEIYGKRDLSPNLGKSVQGKKAPGSDQRDQRNNNRKRRK